MIKSSFRAVCLLLFCVFLFLLSVAGVGLSFIWFEDPALGRDPFLSQFIWKIFEME